MLIAVDMASSQLPLCPEKANKSIGQAAFLSFFCKRRRFSLTLVFKIRIIFQPVPVLYGIGRINFAHQF